MTVFSARAPAVSWQHARAAPIVLILIALLLFVCETYSLAGYRGTDFKVFWDAAQRFVAHPLDLYRHPIDPDPDAAARSLQGYLYPPPAILIFLPFSRTTIATDFVVFSWSMCAATFAALTLWVRIAAPDLSWRWRIAIVSLLSVSGPAFLCRGGQIDPLILLLSVGGCWAMMQDKRATGGALIAIGAWIKIYPALLLVWMGRNGRCWGQLGWFAAAAALVPLAALVAVPHGLYAKYFGSLLPAFSERTIIDIYNQSLVAIVLRARFPHAAALGAYTPTLIPSVLRIAVGVAGLAALLASAWRFRNAVNRDAATAAWTLALIPLVAPLGWGHSYVFALPLHALMIADAIRRGSTALAVTSACAWGALLIPAYARFNWLETVPPWLWQAVYSRYAVAVLVLLAASWVTAPSRQH